MSRVVSWVTANLAFVGFASVALGVMIALTSVAEEVYEAVIESNGAAWLDQPALDLALGWRSPGLDSAVTTFTDIGGPVVMPLLATTIVLALAGLARSWTPVLVALVAAAGSLLLTVVGKDLVGRARPPRELAVPPYEVSPSFPSGHTLNATVLTAIVVHLVLVRVTVRWQRVLVVSVGAVFVLAMGLSRVFLGHHWLTDVVAAWTIGLAWALAVIVAHRLLHILRPSATTPRT